MIIPPKYTLTPKISEFLSKIESAKEVINAIAIPPEIELNIRRQSTLKSSLFSARIEGNTLTLDEFIRLPSKNQQQIEVNNILKALNLVSERHAKDLTAKDLLTFHEIVMKGLIENSNLGKFRTETSAIFNSAGIAIYLPPPPRQIKGLTEKLISYINSQKESFLPIRACIAHFIFEKIHPFLDGNGRVGRILLQAVLAKGGYGMKGLLNVEEKLDKQRTSYYKGLENPERDITDYLEFMLECIALAGSEAKDQILEKQSLEAEDYLLPRRAEILRIVKDQRLVSFDQIRRRFLAINERSLRNDLKKLQDAGLIRKRGETKGVFYEPIKNSTTSPSRIT